MDPNDIRVATTMDQVMAKEIGRQTQVPMLALGIEPRVAPGGWPVDDLRLLRFVGFADEVRHSAAIPRRVPVSP